jgi:hypothetical protein
MFCVANILIGIIGFCGNKVTVETIAFLYGTEITLTPQLIHVIRMMGAFVFSMGLLAGFAIFDPIKNCRIIDGVVVLLFLRVIQRIIFMTQIYNAFGISYLRNFINAGFFLIIAVALLVLRLKIRKE